MSWLILPTVGTADQLTSLSLTNTSELLSILGGLKETIDGFNNKSPVEILDLLASDQAKYEPLLMPILSTFTKRSVRDIIKSWESLKEKYNGEYATKFRALSQKLNELDPELPKIIEWEILDGDIDKNIVKNSQATFNVGALLKASIDIEANSKKPVLPSGVVVDHSDKILIRLGIDGELALDGKLGFSAGVITAGASGSVKGSVDADFYFMEEPDARFGLAAAENVGDLLRCENAIGLCSPFHIDYLQNLLNNHGLYCMKLSADSVMQFDIDMGIAKTFNAGNKIKAKLGASIKSTVKETGGFDYLLSVHEVGGEPVIAVHIKRSVGSEKTVNQSLGIELDPTEFIKSVRPLIEEHLGKAEAALLHFDDLLPGSDYIAGKLGSIIDGKFNDSDFKDDIKVLVGLDANKTPEEVLRDRVIGAIETSADGWSSKIEEAVPGIVDEILASLSQFTPNLPDVKAKIEEAVKSALEEKQSVLTEKVSSYVTDNNAYKTLAKKLNEAGAGISKTITDTQRGVDEAVTALQEILAKLQSKISKIRDLTQLATEKTISLKIAAERKQLSQENLDLRFDLYPERDAIKAQEAMTAILLGEMNKVIDIIYTYRDVDTLPAVVGLSGGYTIYESLSESNSQDLVLWNMNLGSKSILDADVKWTVNIDGSITATSMAEYTRINFSNNEKRTVTFVESAEMLFAHKKSTLNVGLTISREDEQLSVKEVSVFLSGLLDRGLLERDVVNKANDLLSMTGNNNLQKGRLDIGITFTRNQLDKMFSGVKAMRTNNLCDSNDLHCKLPSVICPEGGGEKGCHWVLASVSNTVAQVLVKQHGDKNLIERLQGVLEIIEIDGGLAGGIRKMTPSNTKFYSEQNYTFEEDFLYYNDFDELLGDLTVLEYRRYGAMALYEIIAHMKELVIVGKELSFDGNGDGELPDWTHSQLMANQHRITKLVAVWWQWGHEWKQWAFLTDEMRALNVALLECWVTLAKGPDGGGASPSLWVSLSLPNKDKVLVPRLLI